MKNYKISSLLFAALCTIASGVAFADDTDLCAGLTGNAHGLCNAYCNGMQCQSGSAAQASPNACNKVKGNYQKAVGDPNASLPCECPCASTWGPNVQTDFPTLQFTECSLSTGSVEASRENSTQQEVAAGQATPGIGPYSCFDSAANPPTGFGVSPITFTQAVACYTILTGNSCGP